MTTIGYAEKQHTRIVIVAYPNLLAPKRAERSRVCSKNQGMKGKSPLFSKPKRIAIGNISYMPKNGSKSLFAKYIANRSDIDPNETFDVIAHGSWKSIEVESGGKNYEISAREAAKLIKKQKGFKNAKSVRLLSCSTGDNPEGFAQHLANALGKPVIAPNNVIYSRSDGKYWIEKTDDENQGKFITYKPGGIKHGRK